MNSAKASGSGSPLFCPVKRAVPVAMVPTTAASSTACFEFCAAAPAGASCRRSHGKHETVHRRFGRWADKGGWEKGLAALIQDPSNDYVMLNASRPPRRISPSPFLQWSRVPKSPVTPSQTANSVDDLRLQWGRVPKSPVTASA